jgi:ABC-type bacteriocin/lantibiotic exporter with double-glycine peptidase domain
MAGLYLDVPFVEQLDDGFCGPAALAAILRYWGDFVSQQEIADAVYLSSVNGSLSFDLLRYAEQRGFSATLYHGSLQDIREHLSAGFPLVVVLGQGKNAAGHYVVVVGDDEEGQSLITHDGVRAYRYISYQKFMTLWGKMDLIALRISPQEVSD